VRVVTIVCESSHDRSVRVSTTGPLKYPHVVNHTNCERFLIHSTLYILYRASMELVTTKNLPPKACFYYYYFDKQNLKPIILSKPTMIPKKRKTRSSATSPPLDVSNSNMTSRQRAAAQAKYDQERKQRASEDRIAKEKEDKAAKRLLAPEIAKSATGYRSSSLEFVEAVNSSPGCKSRKRKAVLDRSRRSRKKPKANLCPEAPAVTPLDPTPKANPPPEAPVVAPLDPTAFLSANSPTATSASLFVIPESLKKEATELFEDMEDDITIERHCNSPTTINHTPLEDYHSFGDALIARLNNIPPSVEDLQLSDIPWGILATDTKCNFKNTCALDSLLWLYDTCNNKGIFESQMWEPQSDLGQALALLQSGHFDDARRNLYEKFPPNKNWKSKGYFDDPTTTLDGWSSASKWSQHLLSGSAATYQALRGRCCNHKCKLNKKRIKDATEIHIYPTEITAETFERVIFTHLPTVNKLRTKSTVTETGEIEMGEEINRCRKCNVDLDIYPMEPRKILSLPDLLVIDFLRALDCAPKQHFSELPHIVELKNVDKVYKLAGVIFSHGGIHFTALARLDNCYVDYDGMRHPNITARTYGLNLTDQEKDSIQGSAKMQYIIYTAHNNKQKNQDVFDNGPEIVDGKQRPNKFAFDNFHSETAMDCSVTSLDDVNYDIFDIEPDIVHGLYKFECKQYPARFVFNTDADYAHVKDKEVGGNIVSGWSHCMNASFEEMRYCHHLQTMQKNTPMAATTPPGSTNPTSPVVPTAVAKQSPLAALATQMTTATQSSPSTLATQTTTATQTSPSTLATQMTTATQISPSILATQTTTTMQSPPSTLTTNMTEDDNFVEAALATASDEFVELVIRCAKKRECLAQARNWGEKLRSNPAKKPTLLGIKKKKEAAEVLASLFGVADLDGNQDNNNPTPPPQTGEWYLPSDRPVLSRRQRQQQRRQQRQQLQEEGEEDIPIPPPRVGHWFSDVLKACEKVATVEKASKDPALRDLFGEQLSLDSTTIANKSGNWETFQEELATAMAEFELIDAMAPETAADSKPYVSPVSNFVYVADGWLARKSKPKQPSKDKDVYVADTVFKWLHQQQEEEPHEKEESQQPGEEEKRAKFEFLLQQAAEHQEQKEPDLQSKWQLFLAGCKEYKDAKKRQKEKRANNNNKKHQPKFLDTYRPPMEKERERAAKKKAITKLLRSSGSGGKKKAPQKKKRVNRRSLCRRPVLLLRRKESQEQSSTDDDNKEDDNEGDLPPMDDDDDESFKEDDEQDNEDDEDELVETSKCKKGKSTKASNNPACSTSKSKKRTFRKAGEAPQGPQNQLDSDVLEKFGSVLLRRNMAALQHFSLPYTRTDAYVELEDEPQELWRERNFPWVIQACFCYNEMEPNEDTKSSGLRLKKPELNVWVGSKKAANYLQKILKPGLVRMDPKDRTSQMTTAFKLVPHTSYKSFEEALRSESAKAKPPPPLKNGQKRKVKEEPKKKMPTRPAIKRPDQQLDRHVRIKMKAVEKMMAQTQKMSLPISRTDEPHNPELAESQKNWPWVITGCMCYNEMEPNEDARSTGSALKKPELHMWVGSSKAANYLKKRFPSNLGFKLTVHSSFKSYYDSFRSKSAQAKPPPSRKQDADEHSE